MPSKRYYEIEDTYPCVLYGRPNVEVHTLTCEKHYLRTMWAFKSFFHRCGCAIRPTFVFHDDGSLTEDTKQKFFHHFPGLSLVSPDAAEAAANDKLSSGHHDFLKEHRNSGLMMRKLLDPVFVTDKPYVVWLDTDILWFHKSPMVSDCIKKQIPFYIGGHGGGECYCLNSRTLRVDLKLDPAWNFNAGLIGYPTDKEFFDLDILNYNLRLIVDQAGLSKEKLHWWVAEQTLNAMLFRRDQRSIRIPHARQFSWDPMEHRSYSDSESYRDIDAKTACCHYIGDSGYAEIFTQGAKYLIDNGYLEDWKKKPLEEKEELTVITKEDYIEAKKEVISDRDFSRIPFILLPEYQDRINEVIGSRENFWIQESVDIKPELLPGSYRYRLYIYSNLFEGTTAGHNLTSFDKAMLSKIHKGLLDVHSLNWVRENLYELDEDKIMSLKNYLFKLILSTSYFPVLKVCLYAERMIKDREYIIDDYMVTYVPDLKKYLRK